MTKKDNRESILDAGGDVINPIFIVGMNGSGTSMMLDCLNSHPEIYGFPREMLSIPYYVEKLPKYGDLKDPERFRSLWDDFRNQSCFQWVNGGTPPPLPSEWSDFPHTLTTVIDQTFGYFAHKQGKRRWCEKTPMHAQQIAILHEVFPDACFIHMIRDGRASAASFHRRWRYVPQRTVYRWKKIIQVAREQAAGCEARYIEVFYEQLIRDPATGMQRVCDFLGIAYDDAVLSPSRKRKLNVAADTIVQSAPRWTTYFSDRQLKSLERIAGKTLIELGYDVRLTSGDRDPVWPILQFWALRDHLRRLMKVIWEQATTPKQQRWDTLGGRIRSAIRQKLTSKF